MSDHLVHIMEKSDTYCIEENYAKWDSKRAKDWFDFHGYKAGVNFIPSTASNQLEMFQDETYDPQTIERELFWAADIKFTVIRVYLHHLLWDQYKERFLDRLNDFLSITHSKGISVIFVLFDSCWNPNSSIGKQPDPAPGKHNSCWLQCPGHQILHDTSLFEELQVYVQSVVNRFKNDSRVIMWDIWNEPNNSGYLDTVINPCLKLAFKWVRELGPTQPLTTGVWQTMVRDVAKPFQTLQLQLSDVITFHFYESDDRLISSIEFLVREQPDRPLICTEYMARSNGSKFDPQLRMLKERNIWAINWGLVAGRSQTIYPWTSVDQEPITEEPKMWFHDIFRNDGTPFDVEEIEYIKSVLSM